MDNAGAMAQLQALHQIQGMGGMGNVQVSCPIQRCAVIRSNLLTKSVSCQDNLLICTTVTRRIASL